MCEVEAAASLTPRRENWRPGLRGWIGYGFAEMRVLEGWE